MILVRWENVMEKGCYDRFDHNNLSGKIVSYTNVQVFSHI
jgi:hypothetical protein